MTDQDMATDEAAHPFGKSDLSSRSADASTSAMRKTSVEGGKAPQKSL